MMEWTSSASLTMWLLSRLGDCPLALGVGHWGEWAGQREVGRGRAEGSLSGGSCGRTCR